MVCVLGANLVSVVSAQLTPDPGCTAAQAWLRQYNPQSDPTGQNNVGYPDYNATYWITQISGAAGATVTITGQFPAARYMSFVAYAATTASTLSSLHDSAINPNAGQNNPFRAPGASSAQGKYTIQLVFGSAPSLPAANTLYAGSQTTIRLLYRVYASTNSSDLTGGAGLPKVGLLQSCPVAPVIVPQTSTVWGRLSLTNFAGIAPPASDPAALKPTWGLVAGADSSSFPYVNPDDNYMLAVLSHAYLNPPYNNQLVVVQFQAPTFPDTETGVPPYSNANVRYWSLCTDDPISTAVARCLQDAAATPVNGIVTLVISDPGNAPGASVLNQWGAQWIAWGALESSDILYNAEGQVVTNANGVFYYNHLFYRELLPSTSFVHSIAAVSQLPTSLQQQAMGAYWPQIGYCSLSAFTSGGASCIQQ
jgi:hypothetical protein